MTDLGPADSKYQTNFQRFDEGNGIPHKKELIVRIKGAETTVAVSPFGMNLFLFVINKVILQCS